ncbi:hypothetical protein [Hydrogenophaga sp. 2FB]|uniref:hypothetical protein n=1 Tax=Hydrogenophaga sp. 2FB TaxID=2502187 RepID=UPI0010F7C34D|nr:hypothetical protein [Hydrogenophaga sp. 2FB]
MLTIIKEMNLASARNPVYGSVQHFLERLLVDVAAANYRYFLNDHLSKARQAGLRNPQSACHSPLLENEAQISGLFSAALSGFCPVFRPEFPLAGEVDFMVTYGEREIALENKQVSVESITSAAEVVALEKRWKSVVEQSQRRLALMREDKVRFRHPISIGLLMVRVSQKVRVAANVSPEEKAEKALQAGLKDFNEGALTLGGNVKSFARAHFVAKYEFPREMQIMSGWKRDRRSGGDRVFPGVVFLAHVCTRV